MQEMTDRTVIQHVYTKIISSRCDITSTASIKLTSTSLRSTDPHCTESKGNDSYYPTT